MLTPLRDALLRAEPIFLIAAFLAYAVSVPLVAWRWRVALAGVTGERAPLGTLILASLASSFVNNVTPAARLSGEACRVVALVRLGFASVTSATAAAAYERLSELPALVAIAGVALTVVGRNQHTRAWLAVIGIAIALMVVARRALARTWSRLQERWRRLESVAIQPSALLLSALLTAVVWAFDVLRLRAVAAAFHAPVDITDIVALAAITIVGGLVPTVGGLGAIEGGMIAGLIGMGVNTPDAVAITAAERTMSYGIATLAGFGALSVLGGRSLWNAVRVGAPTAEGAA